MVNRSLVNPVLTLLFCSLILKTFGVVDNEFIEIPEKFEEMNLNKTGLNIAHLNMNGIRSKLDFLKILLFQEKFDILCLNETKIDKSISDSEISIPGYVLYRQDRSLHGDFCCRISKY